MKLNWTTYQRGLVVQCPDSYWLDVYPAQVTARKTVFVVGYGRLGSLIHGLLGGNWQLILPDGRLVPVGTESIADYWPTEEAAIQAAEDFYAAQYPFALLAALGDPP